SQFLLKRILFENELFLVINKPAGIAVHGGSGVRLGLIEAMRQLKPQWKELELAHRLDRDTSGCMIIAKDPIFLRQIHQQLKQKSVNKIYLALVQGYWPDQLIEVDAPLLKNYLRSGERVVRVDKSGKSSLTRFETVEHFGRGATLIKAMPVTGRTHQIRVHCQSTGHAILGDPKYACPGQPGSRPDIKKLCLHAASIEFEAPHGGKMFKFEAPLDEFMEAQFKLLRSQ
ncbi:MAG: RluA family pseudouridine synthase, partial [Gammaproteobacteria bacterium]|nr:RluA family pseudouridine synthase [Gammaproteobacteria bacterium]